MQYAVVCKNGLQRRIFIQAKIQEYSKKEAVPRYHSSTGTAVPYCCCTAGTQVPVLYLSTGTGTVFIVVLYSMYRLSAV